MMDKIVGKEYEMVIDSRIDGLWEGRIFMAHYSGPPEWVTVDASRVKVIVDTAIEFGRLEDRD